MVEVTQQDIENIIMQDRMVSFLTASLNWGAATGMSPQLLDAGKRILMRLQAPVEAPAPAKKEDEKTPDDP